MNFPPVSTRFGSVVLTALLAGAGLACAGCSSTPSGPTEAQLDQQVLTITKATNAELTKSTNNAKPAATDAAYSLAFHHAAVKFAALQVPATAKAKLHALVTALDTMSTEAQAVSVAAAKNQNVEANVTDMAELNLKLLDEEKTEKTAVNALRHALGLPSEPTTTTTAPPATTTPVAKAATTTTTAG
jgi:hypothetical protein